MNKILDWIAANPTLFALVVWPLITGVVTAIFRKPTAEEYAAMNPRWAAFRRLIGAIGLDVPKALETVRLVLTGGKPDDAPKPPSLPPLPILFVVAVLVGCGCNPIKDAKFASDLIHCLDAHTDMPPEQAALMCGVQLTPELVGLFAERKLAKSQAHPCTTIVVDAGAPKGPGI